MCTILSQIKDKFNFTNIQVFHIFLLLVLLWVLNLPEPSPTTPFIPLPHGYASLALTRGDEAVSAPLCLETNLKYPFEQHYIKCLHVNNDGTVTERPFMNWTAEPLNGTNQILLAPFWTDLDTSIDAYPTTGKVYFGVSTKQSLLDEVDKRIHKAFPLEKQFKTKEVAVVKWDDIGSWYGRNGSLWNKRSTFQCVIVVGDNKMFLIYLYGKLMQSPSGINATNFNALVGYTCANHSKTCFYQHELSLTNNIIKVQDTSSHKALGPGQWIFKIEGVLCPIGVAPILNGEVVYGNDDDKVSPFYVGATATYSCNNGYDLEGPKVRTCEKAGIWSGESPTCHCKFSEGHGTGGIWGETCQGESSFLKAFLCTLYSLALHCISALWGGNTPPCQAITCLQLEDVSNGNIKYSTNFTEDSKLSCNTVASYTCNLGYFLDGNSTAVCTKGEGVNGKWNNTGATCKAIVCPFPEVSQPKVMRVKYYPEGKPYFYFGTEAKYSCDAGYTLKGESVRVCVNGTGIDGKWSGIEPTCESDSEGHGGIWGETCQGESTFLKAFLCALYSLTLHCISALWGGNAPTCQAVVCPILERPINGLIDYSNSESNGYVKYGTNAYYSCVDGYSLIGNTSVRVCSRTGADNVSGVWNGSAPLCQSITCLQLEDVSNGNITYSTNFTEDSKLSYNTVASYTCNLGYFLDGNSTAVCAKGEGVNGRWNSTGATCKAICPFLEVSQPEVMVKYYPEGKPYYYFGTEARYSCAAGCTLKGESVRVCGKGTGIDGEWTEIEPTCECNPPLTTDADTNRTVFRKKVELSITADKASTTSFDDHGVWLTVQKGSVREGTLNVSVQVSLETNVRVSESKRQEEKGYEFCDAVSAVSSFIKHNDVTLENPINVTMAHHCHVENDEELIFYILVSTSDGELVFRESRKGNFTRDNKNRQIGSTLMYDSDFINYTNPYFMIMRRGQSKTEFEYSLRVYYCDTYKPKNFGKMIVTMCPDQSPYTVAADDNIGQTYEGISGKSPLVKTSIFGEGQNKMTIGQNSDELQGFCIKPATIEDIGKKYIDRYHNLSRELLLESPSDYPPRVVYHVLPKKQNQQEFLGLDTHNLSPNQHFEVPLQSGFCSEEKCLKGDTGNIKCNNEEDFTGRILLLLGSGLTIVILFACSINRIRMLFITDEKMLDNILKQTNLKMCELKCEIDRNKVAIIAQHFDGVEPYCRMFELNEGQIADVKRICHSESNQSAMCKCLTDWHRRDPDQATYEKLVRILLSMGKTKIAHNICKEIKQNL